MPATMELLVLAYARSPLIASATYPCLHLTAGTLAAAAPLV